MVMIFWWVTALLLVAALTVWGITFWHRRAMRRSPVLVANSRYLERIPSYVRARRTARVLRAAQVGVAVLAVLSASVLSGRIATERLATPEFSSRDIVLCLDVSGSMYEYDTEILATFAALVDDFEGERVALSIFNSTSRTVFPLTNDYDLIQRELENGAEAIDFDEFGYRLGNREYSEDKVRQYVEFVEGTRGIADEASIVPDGLASCAQLFDQAEEDRSRSIIFATDNEVNGEPIFSLEEATERVSSRDIDLYTFYPGAYECGPQCFEELQTATEDQDGELYESSDPEAIPSIIGQIQKTQAEVLGATPTVLRTDHPAFGFVLTFLSLVGILVLGWRSR
ncbi:vWA domain-containing protein [Brachybacterium saurashtrense]|uniref:VWA domain-containing protein n=1 Tax=Brachybacterium saurashtrense TaxID=556288 RepID=A0A345YN75_9MICO|nr:vWA domain-containing protein [Brachybacterium saurashtrense]AXK45377.1 VWA domain-containing protein [Brachybacterium saurashtrense]RRR21866.1 VWA domain-containing protein [Brachybacterium saurashtrense]